MPAADAIEDLIFAIGQPGNNGGLTSNRTGGLPRGSWWLART